MHIFGHWHIRIRIGWLLGLLLLGGVLAACDSNSPAPVPTAVPTATTEPLSTVALGTFDCVAVPGNPSAPQLQTCWRGKINGAYVTVGAGHAGLGPDGQRRDQQGVIVVTDGPDLWAASATRRVYGTPQAAGGVRIFKAAGTRLTVATTTTPQVLFTFDLATRQWANP